MDDLLKRVQELEAIVIAMTSGRKFSVGLNEFGQPVLTDPMSRAMRR